MKRAQICRLWLCLACLSGLSSTGWAQTFAGLPGVNPMDPVVSTAAGVSSDGQVVVGESALQAVRWTGAGATLEVLGVPMMDTTSTAAAANADGAIVAGTGFTGSVGSAFLWDPMNLFVGLGGTNSVATSVANDGLTAAGFADFNGAVQAFRWTMAGGFQILGVAPGGANSRALGMSDDGVLIVGETDTPDGLRGFIYTDPTGLKVMPPLRGATSSRLVDASGDGSTLVGESGAQVFPGPTGHVVQMYRRAPTGTQGLGDLAGGSFNSHSRAVSADGNAVVGAGTIDVSGDVSVAVLWTPVNGLLDLRNLLVQEYGLDLTGWTLTEATGVSGDGRTIVGNGVNPDGNQQGWVATLPATPIVQVAPALKLDVRPMRVGLDRRLRVTLTATKLVDGEPQPIIGQNAQVTVTSPLGSLVIANGITDSEGQVRVTYRPGPALGTGPQLLKGTMTLADGTSSECIARFEIKP